MVQAIDQDVESRSPMPSPWVAMIDVGPSLLGASPLGASLLGVSPKYDSVAGQARWRACGVAWKYYFAYDMFASLAQLAMCMFVYSVRQCYSGWVCWTVVSLSAKSDSDAHNVYTSLCTYYTHGHAARTSCHIPIEWMQ